jgi:hypothetical protein
VFAESSLFILFVLILVNLVLSAYFIVVAGNIMILGPSFEAPRIGPGCGAGGLHVKQEEEAGKQ